MVGAHCPLPPCDEDAISSRSTVFGGIVPLAVTMDLLLEVTPVWVIGCFFGAIDAKEEAFWRIIRGLDGRKISSVDSRSQ